MTKEIIVDDENLYLQAYRELTQEIFDEYDDFNEATSKINKIKESHIQQRIRIIKKRGK